MARVDLRAIAPAATFKLEICCSAQVTSKLNQFSWLWHGLPLRHSWQPNVSQATCMRRCHLLARRIQGHRGRPGGHCCHLTFFFIYMYDGMSIATEESVGRLEYTVQLMASSVKVGGFWDPNTPQVGLEAGGTQHVLLGHSSKWTSVHFFLALWSLLLKLWSISQCYTACR